MNTNILELSFSSILIRILLSVLIGGMIGYERGSRNQAAGFRTHILVCLGATLIALIQEQLRVNILHYAIEYSVTTQVLKTDLGRIGAQVVSGIGFLGAGAIIREEKTIVGLTTAASVWVTGCIGLGVGWGFYRLAILSGVVVLIVLVTLKKIEIVLKSVSILYVENSDMNENLKRTIEIFNYHNIKIKTLRKLKKSQKILYVIALPKGVNTLKVLAELTEEENIEEIREI